MILQGTEGIWMDVNKGIYIQDKSAKAHQWDEAKKWLDENDHPLWKRYGSNAQGAGHGGMDFFVIHSFIESAKRKLPTAMDETTFIVMADHGMAASNAESNKPFGPALDAVSDRYLDVGDGFIYLR